MKFITLLRADGVYVTFNIDHIRYVEASIDEKYEMCYVYIDSSIPFCIKQSYLEVVGELKGMSSGH
jgi:hypothetical protein